VLQRIGRAFPGRRDAPEIVRDQSGRNITKWRRQIRPGVDSDGAPDRHNELMASNRERARHLDAYFRT
jgi:hypothetical protein